MLRLLTLVFAMLLCLRVQAGVNEAVHERNRALPDYEALHAMVNTAEKPIFWLFVGDSITHGCLHTHGGRSFAEHWMELVKWELMPRPKQRRTNDLVLNAGVSGETAPGFLQNAAWRLEQFRPQVVFINFGINDASRYGDTAAFRAALAANALSHAGCEGGPPALCPSRARRGGGAARAAGGPHRRVGGMGRAARCLLRGDSYLRTRPA